MKKSTSQAPKGFKKPLLQGEMFLGRPKIIQSLNYLNILEEKKCSCYSL